MDDDSSGNRSQQTLAKHMSFNGNGERKIGLYDWPENGLEGGDVDRMEVENDKEEECDVEVWETLSNSFNQVQSVLEQNKLLIKQVNENQHSKIPDNLVKNVALIREINLNISKVVSLYSDLSVSFSTIFHQRRSTPETSSGDGVREECQVPAGLRTVK